MKNATVGVIDILARLNTKHLSAGVTKAKGLVSNFGGSIAGLARAAGPALASGAMAALAGGIAAVGVAAALATNQVRSMAMAGGQLVAEEAKQADMIGVAADEFSHWTDAMKLMKVEGEDFASFMRELNLRIGETANEASGPMKDLFDLKGWDFDAFAMMEPFERVLWIADKVKNANGQADKNSILDLLGGGDGQEKMLGVLQKGREGIQELLDTTSKFKLENNEGLISANAMSAVGELGVQYDALSKKLFAKLAPAVQSVAELFLGWMNGVDIVGWIDKGISVLLPSVAFALTGFQLFKGVIETTGALAIGQFAAMAKGIDLLAQGIDGLTGSNLHSLTGPISQTLTDVGNALAHDAMASSKAFASGDTYGKQFLDGVSEAMKAEAPNVDPVPITLIPKIAEGEVSAQDVLGGLIDEFNELEFGAAYMEEFNLRAAGATEETIARIKAQREENQLIKDKAALAEKEQSEWEAVQDKRKDFVKGMLDELKSPADRMKEEMEMLKLSHDLWEIDDKQFDSLKEAIKEKYKQGVKEGNQLLQASEVGSLAGQESLARFKQSTVNKVQEKIEKHVSKSEEWLGKISFDIGKFVADFASPAW